MAPRTPEPRRRRDRGDNGTSRDKVNKCYVGTISLGYDGDGKRGTAVCPRQDQDRGKGQARRAARRDQGWRSHSSQLHGRAVRPGLARLDRARSAHHGHLSRAGREVDLSEDRRKKLGGFHGHRRRTIPQRTRQGAQQAIAGDDQEHARGRSAERRYDLIGRNVAELVDLPSGQPGRPSRAMTEAQATKVLKAASGRTSGLSRW